MYHGSKSNAHRISLYLDRAGALTVAGKRSLTVAGRKAPAIAPQRGALWARLGFGAAMVSGIGPAPAKVRRKVAVRAGGVHSTVPPRWRA